MSIKFCRFPGTSGDYASAPDNAAFSALTDFSVLCLVSLDDWTPATSNIFAAHSTNTGNQRSWNFAQITGNNLRLNLSTAGTALTAHTADAAHGFTDGTVHWVMVTRASASGDVKFYTAAYVPGSVAPPAIGSFTQLGSTINNGITGALHNSTTTLTVAASDLGGTAPLDGDEYRVLLYTGIYGSGSEVLVRDFNPSDAASTSDTSWASDTTGETWTLNGGDPALYEIFTVEPAGASVSVTPGTPSLDLSIAPAGPTVTVTPGAVTVNAHQAIAPTGPTVSVTPGTAILALSVAPSGPTVTVTAGTASVVREEQVAPAGPTVTVTPGTPSLALSIAPTGPTVAVTPGSPSVVREEQVSPTGPTVTVTPGTPALALSIGPSGPTVGVTPGTVTVTNVSGQQDITPAGASVSVTPGTPTLDLSVAPSGPTVTVTPGTPTITLSIAPVGASVAVTPGTPVFALALTPTGPTVTVTPGTPALALALLLTGPTVTITPGTVTVTQVGGNVGGRVLTSVARARTLSNVDRNRSTSSIEGPTSTSAVDRSRTIVSHDAPSTPKG